MNLARLAGYSVVATAVAMPLSAVALWLFFSGAGSFYGPINDVLIALALVLLGPALLAYRRLTAAVAGRWFTVSTYLALAGIGIAALGQILLVVGVISLEASFVTFGVGSVALLAGGACLA